MTFFETLREWAHRVRGTILRSPSERELKRELEIHLEMAEEALRRRGHSAEEATRLARLRFDSVPRALDALHEQRGLPWLGRFSLDVKIGARRLRKSWGLTLVGGFAMTIAIAIATGGFNFVRALSGGSVPLEEGDRVVAIQTWSDQFSERAQPTVAEDFKRWRDELLSVDDVGAFRTVSRSLGLSGDAPLPSAAQALANIVSVAEMSAAGFRIARVAPLRGRPLVEADERVEAEPVVVIGYDAWRSRFAEDPQIIGRRVRLDGTLHTVVGVMPPHFEFPINHQYWIPLRAEPPARAWNEGPEIFVFGRLAPGATLETAAAELGVLGLAERPLELDTAEGPGAARLYPRISPYAQAFLYVADGWSQLIMLLLTLLLVPPCANVAILVYARTIVRQQEFAVRTALGASRSRIVAQLFIEMLVLSAVAALAALAIIQLVLGRAQLSLSHSPGGSPFWMNLGVSAGSVLYMGALAMLAAAIAGVVPAIKATGSVLQSGLRALGGGAGMRLGNVWNTMIVVQVALAVLVLPLAAELGWGLLRPSLVGPGFAPEQYMTARVQFFGQGSGDAGARAPSRTARFAALQAELVRRMEAEAGIEAAAVSQSVPGADGSGSTVGLERHTAPAEPGAPLDPPEQVNAAVNRVGRGFFGAFDVPVLAGRAFSAEDFEAGRNPALINRTFAERIASDRGGPLGMRVRTNRRAPDADTAYEIVGVLADLPANDEMARLYIPLPPTWSQPVMLTFRVNPGTSDVAGRLRDLASSLDSALVVDQVIPLDALYLQQRITSASGAATLAAVTLSVLLLSAAGMYALMSFTVNQRRREIGIRSALGAQPGQLLGGVLGRPLGQVGAGAALGLLAAYLLGRLIRIEDLGGRDVPGVLAHAAVFMIVVGVLAVAGPARRALRVMPTEALRDDG